MQRNAPDTVTSVEWHINVSFGYQHISSRKNVTNVKNQAL